ncbi:hypothetical protein RB653_003425 [Dictyostelium firmibasis]|uniref:Uncharacterized protein n=1 Tax=Dictyostelium firmibasis TaxID=79012 RepID=A0AAN7U4N0_9MYCE
MVGQASYYNDAGFGSCGTTIDANSQLLVAVPPNYWTTANPNADPICNSQIKVTYNGKSITLPVRDKCPSCGPTKIDISAPAFIQLAGGLEKGILDITWEFVNGSTTISNSATSGTVTGSGGNGCSKTAVVNSGQGCWDVWTSKCGNSWSQSQFDQVNPGITCTNLNVGQILCCGGSSGSSSSSSTGTVTGTIGTCSKKGKVEAGQGCWDIWTSKCGNSWSQSQFDKVNPGIICTNLKIGQELCCN